MITKFQSVKVKVKDLVSTSLGSSHLGLGSYESIFQFFVLYCFDLFIYLKWVLGGLVAGIAAVYWYGVAPEPKEKLFITFKRRWILAA